MTRERKVWTGIIFAVVLVTICVAAVMLLQNGSDDDGNAKPVLTIDTGITAGSQYDQINLTVENTLFRQTISVNDVHLGGALISLDLNDVTLINPREVILHVDGTVYKDISDMAVVTVSANATESNMELKASRVVSD